MISRNKLIAGLLLICSQAFSVDYPSDFKLPTFKKIETNISANNPLKNASLKEGNNVAEITDEREFISSLKEKIQGLISSPISSQNLLLMEIDDDVKKQREVKQLKKGDCIKLANAKGATKGEMALILSEIEHPFVKFTFNEQTLVIDISPSAKLGVKKPFAFGLTVHPEGWVIATGLNFNDIENQTFEAFFNNISFNCNVVNVDKLNNIALFKIYLPEKLQLPFLKVRTEPLQDGEKLEVQEFFGQQEPLMGSVWDKDKVNPSIAQSIGSASFDKNKELISIKTPKTSVSPKDIQFLFKGISFPKEGFSSNAQGVLIYAKSE